MHLEYMKLAIEEAKKAEDVYPNPKVGAVLIKEGRVISKGYHAFYGGPHAERVAIEKTREDLGDATLYVTLEPCNHYGKTPPCTHLIIEAGISCVVIGMLDPNPLMRGKSVDCLRAHGIKVIVGVCASEVSDINRDFIERMSRKSMVVTAKYAMTLDGKIACDTGDSKWITSEASRKFTHELRNRHDAILVGVGTVKKDDPELTVRHVTTTKQPHRFVIDPKGETPLGAKVLTSKEACTTLLVSKALPEERRVAYLNMGINLEMVEPFTVSNLLEHISLYDVNSLLIEGGAITHYHFFKHSKVEVLYVFIAPKLLVGSGITPTEGQGPLLMSETQQWHFDKVETLGPDLVLVGRPKCLQD